MKTLGRLNRLAISPKHDRVGQALANELQTHQPIIDIGKGRSGKLDHVHFNASRRQIFLRAKRSISSARVMIKRAVNQVHSDNPERFLLLDVRIIEHAHMNDDLARFAATFLLKSNPEPAVRFVVVSETARRHRVGKNKKRAFARRVFDRAARSVA